MEFSRGHSLLSRTEIEEEEEEEEAVLERILGGFLCVSCTYRDYSHKTKFQLVKLWYVSEAEPLCSALSWKLQVLRHTPQKYFEFFKESAGRVFAEWGNINVYSGPDGTDAHITSWTIIIIIINIVVVLSSLFLPLLSV